MPRNSWFLLLALAGCVPAAPATDDSAAREAVAARWESYAAAVTALRFDTLPTFFSAGAHVYEPGLALRGRDSIAAFIRSLQGVKIEDFVHVVDTIEIHGDHASLWGTFSERVTLAGQPQIAKSGRFVIEWGRQANGEWTIDRFMTQEDPAPVQH